MNELINWKKVRDLALHVSQTERNGRFKRVSATSFGTYVNEQLRVIVIDRVRRHPSLGVTLK